MKVRVIAYIFCTLTVTACVTAMPKSSPTAEQLAASKGYQLGEPVKRIMNYQLNGWNYVNSRALIIKSTPSKDYLVILKDQCHELSSQEVIGTTATGNAMQAGFDAIVVKLPGATKGLGKYNSRKCYIDNIYKLTRQPGTSSSKSD